METKVAERGSVTSLGRAALLLTGMLALLAGAAVWPAVEDAGAARLNSIGSFKSPIYATGAPGDTRRLFVVERGGAVRVVRGGKKLERPFLRISKSVSTAGERGLLSIAFAPGYQANRRFYVFYTDRGGDLRVDEFLRSPANPDRALGDSRRKVIEVEHSARSNHNGGQLQFGPDGLLYVSTGDGGGSGAPAQSTTSLLGKLLRIDPSRRSAGRPYAVPSSNPFVGRAGADEVFALGLRNPYRFSFDRATGALVTGDVGEGRFEEVDYRLRRQAPGPNFGWPCFEGRDRYEGAAPGCRLSYGRHVPPVLQRSHATGDCSIIGGYVARHPSLGSLRGRYIYGDFCTGRLRSAELRQGRAVGDRRVRGARLAEFTLVSFGQGSGGGLYVVSSAGRVFRLRG
jgi:hypothetical protein